jgi:thioredoxin 1
VSKVVEVSDRNYDEEVMNSDLPTEVDFWAPWCGPCTMVSPVYDKLAKEYDGRFKFCKVNVDENPALAARFQVMSIPYQLFIVDGEKVDELLGAVPEQSIRKMVDSIIADYPTDPAGRLKSLLGTWKEHNTQDTTKLKKWMEKARLAQVASGDGALLEQAGQLQSSSEGLQGLLSGLEQKL